MTHRKTPAYTAANALRAIKGAQTSVGKARVASHHRPLERAAFTKALLALADALRHAREARRLKVRRVAAREARAAA